MYTWYMYFKIPWTKFYLISWEIAKRLVLLFMMSCLGGQGVSTMFLGIDAGTGTTLFAVIVPLWKRSMVETKSMHDPFLCWLALQQLFPCPFGKDSIVRGDTFSCHCLSPVQVIVVVKGCQFCSDKHPPVRETLPLRCIFRQQRMTS